MLLSIGTVGVLTAAWALLWPVPTEVIGRGVVIVPGGASVIDARAEGQILELPVAVGQEVRRGQPLVRLFLPALEQQVRRQEKDLAELIRIDADLNRRDAARLITTLPSLPNVKVIESDAALFQRAVQLYARRADKEWSLTDCISIIVMEDEELTDVLTRDHHFKQAGFTPVFADAP